MSWHSLRITNAAAADEIISALFDAGAMAVEEKDGAIITHFPPGTDIQPVQLVIASLDSSATVTIGDTQEIDPAMLHGSVSAQRIGSITIAPPWEATAINDPGLVIIDPAMGFGTGEHPTTRGVIRLMQKVITHDDTVADLGAGSAILSIAAAKLGASRVFAIENDWQAIGNAEENVQANMVSGEVSVFLGDAADLLPVIGPVTLVFANIISSVLLLLMETIHANISPGGHAILSGILATERESVLDRAASADFDFVDEDFEGEWWSVLLRRP